MISLHHLRVDYGDFTDVHDLSLEIPAGSIFGLVGPNGAGKTSTIKVLATLLEPTYGEVRIGGIDVEADVTAVRRKLGYMPDLAPVIGNLRVEEFLDHFARSYGFADSTVRRNRVKECLDLVKMGESAKKFCKGLSRGMMQRVVMAKTLLHDPDVYLLDEPASGMDPMARLDLRDLLLTLSRSGKTVLISSHILTELAEMCTDIGLIHKGRLHSAGPVSTVLEGVETPQRKIFIKTVGESEGLGDFLKQREQVLEVKREKDHWVVIFQGGGNDQAALLREMVKDGFPILHFEPRKAGLEELLRKVSEGA